MPLKRGIAASNLLDVRDYRIGLTEIASEKAMTCESSRRLKGASSGGESVLGRGQLISKVLGTVLWLSSWSGSKSSRRFFAYVIDLLKGKPSAGVASVM